MKIRSTDHIRVNTAKTKKSEVKDGAFQELLNTRLDAVHPQQESENSGEKSKNTGNTLQLIENATLMLDEAMKQLQQSGQPSEEIAHSLNLLRDQLKQKCPDSDNLKAADAIIAVETSRLEAWKL